MNSELYDKLQSDLKNQMKVGNKDNVILIRGIIAKIKDETVNKGKELTDDIVQRCIERTVKEIDQSIDSFKTANRMGDVEKLESDKIFVSKYLPKMLSESETLNVINTIIKTIEPVKKNMGVIMKQLPKEVNKSVASKILNMILH